MGGRAYHVGREMDVMTLVADALEVDDSKPFISESC